MSKYKKQFEDIDEITDNEMLVMPKKDSRDYGLIPMVENGKVVGKKYDANGGNKIMGKFNKIMGKGNSNDDKIAKGYSFKNIDSGISRYNLNDNITAFIRSQRARAIVESENFKTIFDSLEEPLRGEVYNVMVSLLEGEVPSSNHLTFIRKISGLSIDYILVFDDESLNKLTVIDKLCEIK